MFLLLKILGGKNRNIIYNTQHFSILFLYAELAVNQSDRVSNNFK
jgi:hypothetical protein